MRIFLAAIALAGLPALASATTIEVSRCNGAEVGQTQYDAGLLVRTPVRTTFFPVGWQGLSRSDVFDRDRAFAWVTANLDVAGYTLVNYDGHVCGHALTADGGRPGGGDGGHGIDDRSGNDPQDIAVENVPSRDTGLDRDLQEAAASPNPVQF